MNATVLVCPRCGEPEEMIEVTTYDSAHPQYVQGRPCPCPGPRCPFCMERLDDGGHCQTMDCWAFSLIIPIPTIAPDAPRNATGSFWVSGWEGRT